MVVDAVWLVAGSWRRMWTYVSSGGSRRATYSPRKTKEVIAGKRELWAAEPTGQTVRAGLVITDADSCGFWVHLPLYVGAPQSTQSGARGPP